VKTGLLPGSAILCFHQNDDVRKWASNNIAGINPAAYCTADDSTDLIGILQQAKARLRNREMSIDSQSNPSKSSTSFSKHFNLTSDPTAIWIGFSTILSVFLNEAVDEFISHMPEMLGLTYESFNNDIEENQFWPILQCFTRLSLSPKSYWQTLGDDVWVETYKTILGHRCVKELLTTPPDFLQAKERWDVTHLMRVDMCFEWIPSMLKWPGKHLWFSDVIDMLVSESTTWPCEYRRRFAQLAIVPILSSFSASLPSTSSANTMSGAALPKNFLGRLSVFALQLPSLDGTSDSSFTHLLLEYLSSDIDTLESFYSEFYESRSSIRITEVETHVDIWRSLNTHVLSVRPALVEGILTNIKRLGLMDLLQMKPSSFEEDPVKAVLVSTFNENLKVMWSMIEDALVAKGMTVCGAVQKLDGTILTLMCCPNDKISDKAWSLLCKLERVERYFVFLFIQ
jgi:hypothetical protein